MDERATALRKALSSRPAPSFTSSERAFLAEIFGREESEKMKKKKVKKKPASASKGKGGAVPGTFGSLAMANRASQHQAHARALAQRQPVHEEQEIEQKLLGDKQKYTEQEEPHLEAHEAIADMEGETVEPAEPAQPSANPPPMKKKVKLRKTGALPPPPYGVAQSTDPPHAEAGAPRQPSSPPSKRRPWMPSSPQALPLSVLRAVKRQPDADLSASVLAALAPWEPRQIDPVVSCKLAIASAKSQALHHKKQVRRALAEAQRPGPAQEAHVTEPDAPAWRPRSARGGGRAAGDGADNPDQGHGAKAGPAGQTRVATTAAPVGGRAAAAAVIPPKVCFRGVLHGSALTIHEFTVGAHDYPPFRFKLSVGAARRGVSPEVGGPSPTLWVQRERRPNRTFFDWRSTSGEVVLLPDVASKGSGGGRGERGNARVLPGMYYVAIGANSTGHGGTGLIPLAYSLCLYVEGRAGGDPSGPLFCGQGESTGADGGKYVGEHWCGIRHGQGTLTSADGYVIRGEWRLGKAWNVAGQMRMTCAKDGSIVSEQSLAPGGGTVAKALPGAGLPAVFDGELMGGLRSGPNGGLAFSDGDLLVGEWVDGVFTSGRVRHTYPNGDVYEGEWRAGKGRGVRYGSGTLTLAGDAGVLKGEWRDDAPWQMQGAEWWASTQDGGWRYRGDWLNGLRHGHGEVHLSCGASFVGWWRGGKWHGAGTLMLPPVAEAEGHTYAAKRTTATTVGETAPKDSRPTAEGGGSSRGYRGKFEGDWMSCIVREAELIPEGGTFSGELKLGLREGQGTLRLADGNSYVGGFVSDHYHGHGTLQSAELEYRGAWEAGQRHGAGRECLATAGGGSEIFEGEWVRGVRSRGTLTEADGSYTRGVWDNGALDESRPVRRKCVLPNGDRWEGEWAEGQPHGSGTLITVAGDHFKGLFENGVLRQDRHAEVKVAMEGGIVYEGGWIRGAPEGRGQKMLSDGAVMSGNWKGGVPHECRGTTILEGGHRFVGSIRWGKAEGRGSIRYANGARYEGGFRAGLPAIDGVCVEADGTRYEGEWADGFRNGRGVMCFPGGDRISADWVRGERVPGKGAGGRGTAASRYATDIFISRRGASETDLLRQAAVALTPERLAMGSEAAELRELPPPRIAPQSIEDTTVSTRSARHPPPHREVLAAAAEQRVELQERLGTPLAPVAEELTPVDIPGTAPLLQDDAQVSSNDVAGTIVARPNFARPLAPAISMGIGGVQGASNRRMSETIIVRDSAEASDQIGMLAVQGSNPPARRAPTPWSEKLASADEPLAVRSETPAVSSTCPSRLPTMPGDLPEILTSSSDGKLGALTETLESITPDVLLEKAGTLSVEELTRMCLEACRG